MAFNVGFNILGTIRPLAAFLRCRNAFLCLYINEHIICIAGNAPYSVFFRLSAEATAQAATRVASASNNFPACWSPMVNGGSSQGAQEKGVSRLGMGFHRKYTTRISTR